jgi:hypothetical protein
MSRPLSILWRGSLDSCNYSCTYCPFAKRTMSASGLAADRLQLERFVQWAKNASTWRLRVLFTPYGEALIHPWYQAALTSLSHAQHIDLVSIQTNGSGSWDWLNQANLQRLSLWITWHPSQISRSTFGARMRRLHEAGVQFSVGCVAVPDTLTEVEALRSELPNDIYLWVNAQRPKTEYDAHEIQRWTAIDPHFPLDLFSQASHGRSCRTGRDVISIDGDGDIRRCHFIPTVLGNLYRHTIDKILTERPCSRVRCECYIGYSHLDDLAMQNRVGASYFARLVRPETLPTSTLTG